MAKGLDDKENGKGKTTSLYLSSKSIHELDSLQTFFPDFSLPELIRKSLDQWCQNNKILFDINLDQIDDIFYFLKDMEKKLYEYPRKTSSERIDIKNSKGPDLPEFINYLYGRDDPEDEDRIAAELKKAEKSFNAIINSFLEILLCNCSRFRKEFVINCMQYGIDPTYLLECHDEIYNEEYSRELKQTDEESGQNEAEKYETNDEGTEAYWIYRTLGDWSKSFITGNYKFQEGYIQATEISSPFTSTMSFAQLVRPLVHPTDNKKNKKWMQTQYEYPHDPGLLLRLFLVKSFHTFLINEKPVLKKLLDEILESQVNRYQGPSSIKPKYKLTIDFDGNVEWRGRKVMYPCRIEKDDI